MGFLNDFMGSSGIIFEFHYNFIIFFVFGFHDSIQKISIFFTPYTPQKMTILAKFGHFGTFWYFLDFFWPPIPPKKNKKILYWHNFAILAFFDTFGIFFTPYNPKKPKKWIFWQNLAILPLFSTFLGGGQNCQ